MRPPDHPRSACAAHPCPRVGTMPWGETLVCSRHWLTHLEALVDSAADRLDTVADQRASTVERRPAQGPHLTLAL